MTRLPRQFYERSTLKVAPDLLGQFLVRKVKSTIKTIITEVEAYVGERDPACHACRGRTERNAVMYGEAGRAYVYFIYGMYYCLNIVTERRGFPAAVLVRGVMSEMTKERRQKDSSHSEAAFGGRRIPGIIGTRDHSEASFDTDQRLNGPGKLCRQLKIDKTLNGVDLVTSRELWIEENPRQREFLRKYYIKKTPRIGIRQGKEKLWRWVVELER